MPAKPFRTLRFCYNYLTRLNPILLRDAVFVKL